VCLLLLPLVVPAIVTAPVFLPRLLGAQWTPAVAPLQILVLVGVGETIVNVLLEALNGCGRIRFSACVHIARLVGLVPALLLFVRIDGIRGAAIAHLVTFIPISALCLGRGLGLVESSMRRLAGAVRGVVLAVAAQVAATIGALLFVARVGLPREVGAPAAAAFGLVVMALVLLRSDPEVLQQGRTARVALQRRRARSHSRL
jgi:PST family polysaccharide transporter